MAHAGWGVDGVQMGCGWGWCGDDGVCIFDESRRTTRRRMQSMKNFALFDPEQRRPLVISAVVLVGLSVLLLSGFFIDLFSALMLRAPSDALRTWLPLVAGPAGALLVPVAGACAGMPERKPRKSKQWWSLSPSGKVTVLLIALGVAIALARYAKAHESLEAKRQRAVEKARADRLAAVQLAADSPEAKARAQILAARAQMMASAAKAMEQGAARLTPRVRKDAVELATLAAQPATVGTPSAREAPAVAIDQVRRDGPDALTFGEVARVALGPALTEFLFAELIAFVAAMWGRFAFSLARSQDEDIDDVFDGLQPDQHPAVIGVDLGRLPADAVAELDLQAGTWCGLPLGPPAIRGQGREATLWPTLAVEGPRKVFIASRQAHEWHRKVLNAQAATTRQAIRAPTTKVLHELSNSDATKSRKEGP